MNKFSLLTILSLSVLLTFCNPEVENINIPFDNPELSYSGRTEFAGDSCANLRWSGSSVVINFKGDKLKALIKDESGDNYFNLLIDQDSAVLFRPKSHKKEYILAQGLGKGPHRIEIFKRTEWDRGSTSFYGFGIPSKGKLLTKQAEKTRKIEFYGNSITAGYAIEDYSENDSPDSIFTNNYLSYAALTARHFDAEYFCICKSGIGITISWFPTIMPEIFDLLDPENPESKWDFSEYTPDIVVINLFQNDSWLVLKPERLEFKDRFGDTAPDEKALIKAYTNFISEIRTRYPNAQLICALGNMDATKKGSVWPGYIEKAVEIMNDSKIHTHFMAYKNTPGHPKIEEQEVMAESLIQFINKNIEW